MPDLEFRVEDASPVPYAAVPLLSFRIAVDASPGAPILSVALRAQIQLEVTRRRYSPGEQEHLVELFDEQDRWGQTLRSMLWTNVGTTIPAFTGSTSVELQVPCTFDFNVASTKYFHGLDDGEVPLCFLFSGSVFYDSGDGSPHVAPIPWSKEGRFRLPVRTWKEMMEVYYPNTAWVCLRRDIFERLYQYKIHNSITTWEDALERLLSASEAAVGR